MIKVKLTGDFQKLAPAGSEKGLFSVECEDGLTLLGLLAQLGVESAGIKYNVLVNNSRKDKGYVLQDADSIIVMPLLAGG